ELRPGSSLIFSSYLLAQHANPAVDGPQSLLDHLAWGGRFAAPLDPGPRGASLVTDSSPDRRLRVGYVSGDLRSHSVASFIEPILEAHDRSAVELFCYSDGIADAVTARIKAVAGADGWRETRMLTDAALAARVIEDGIDILVDLAGHSADNRLLAFARRPAPVQVTYCGYPGTTGVAAIGWRLTDAEADPRGDSDSHYSERLWRLPHGFLCFRPDPDAPAAGPLPAEANGFVTFGSFNNLSKLSEETLDLWGIILQMVPGSRLVLKSRGLSDLPPRQRLLHAFQARGVDPARVQTIAYAATPRQHLRLYDQIDIALDPFPYNGTTTTCEALWMGVPVVTVAGRTHAGRVGASLLHRVGYPELIASNRSQVLRIARGLAGDLPGLATLRNELRPKMMASALANPRLIAGDIEAAYRAMWRQWCAQQGQGTHCSATDAA
ncbi:MAG: hypothetical protein ABI560_14820, partial [Myxococcales bacterium]